MNLIVTIILMAIALNSLVFVGWLAYQLYMFDRCHDDTKKSIWEEKI